MSNYIKMNNTYSTNDLALASALSAEGLPVIEMEKYPDGRVFLYFQDREKAQSLEKRFWSRTLTSDSRTILEEFKALKQRIFNLSK